MDDQQQVIAKPIGTLSAFRRFLRHLPGFCSYCGKFYVPCHSNQINLLMPVPQNGRCCPDGHEGYTKEFTGYYTATYRFDNVNIATE